jgi:hypothetical protein
VCGRRWIAGLPATKEANDRYDETRNNTASIAYGLWQTASIITGAALIMVAVFAGMASGELVKAAGYCGRSPPPLVRGNRRPRIAVCSS